MSAGDRSKLPKWAQGELSRLERDLRHAERRLEEAYQAAGLNQDGYGRVSLLDPYAHVRFQLPDPHPVRAEQGHQVDVEVNVDDGQLTVRSANGMLAIRPVAGNTIRVGLER